LQRKVAELLSKIGDIDEISLNRFLNDTVVVEAAKDGDSKMEGKLLILQGTRRNRRSSR
jgi:hypothetical protein